MSFIVFLLSMSIIFLLTKSTRKRKRIPNNHEQKTKKLLSNTITGSYTYTNNVLYRTNNDNKFFVEKKNQKQLFPIKSELSVRPMSYPIYSISSSHSLPPLVLPSPSPPPIHIPPVSPQPLSVTRLYKSYV
jgi:hypothetical protein